MRIDPLDLFTIKGAVTLPKKHQFAGREDLLSKSLDEIVIDGSVHVIFGERGSGKTSLGWQLLGPLSGDRTLLKERSIRPKLLREKQFHCIWCTCNSWIKSISDLVSAIVLDPEPEFTLRSSFPELFEPSFMTRIQQKYGVGWWFDAPASPKQKPVPPPPPPPGPRSGTNEDLGAFLALEEMLARAQKNNKKTGFVFFLDEFDRLEKRAEIGDLLKALNNVRFVILGVGASRSALVAQHASVGRKISSCEVPLFTPDEVNSFFDNVEKRSDMSVRFTRDFRSTVAGVSSGFPWLVQQLGFYSLLRVMGNDGIDSAGTSIKLGVDVLEQMLPTFLRDKLGGDPGNLPKIDSVEGLLLRALSSKRAGRMSRDDLVNTLPSEMRGFYERAVRALEDLGLVYKQQQEVRIKDPLTKVLVELSIENRIL